MIAPLVVWVMTTLFPEYSILADPETTFPELGKLCATAGAMGIAIAATKAEAKCRRRRLCSCLRFVLFMRMPALLKMLSESTKTREDSDPHRRSGPARLRAKQYSG